MQGKQNPIFLGIIDHRMPHGLKKWLCDSTGGVYSGRARPRVGLAAGSADLMRMVMAKLAEIISADSILITAHLYPGE